MIITKSNQYTFHIPSVFPYTSFLQARSICFFFVLFCFSFVNASAQDIRTTAALDTSSIKIGDQIKLHIRVRYPASTTVGWPLIPDTLSNIEILERSEIITEDEKNNSITERQTYTITAFEAGKYTIPSFVFSYKKSGDTTQYQAATDSLELVVETIPIDTTQTIKDIKPPLEEPFTWREAIPYMVGGLLLVAILAAVYYYFIKNRKKAVAVVPVEPERPPHENALEALKRLEAEKLWQQGQLKLYHSKLSDTVRIYIEKRFGVRAPELTTDETLQQLRTVEPRYELREELRQILQLSDLVKFAKATPLDTENEKSLRNAFDFVEQTKLQEEIARKEEVKA